MASATPSMRPGAAGPACNTDARNRGTSGYTSSLVATGFCGGFTTLSSLVYEAAGYAREGRPGLAAGYVAGTLGLAAPAFALGLALAAPFGRGGA